MELEVKHLSVTFPSDRGPVKVLRDVTISFPAGKITAVVGESGSGNPSLVPASWDSSLRKQKSPEKSSIKGRTCGPFRKKK